MSDGMGAVNVGPEFTGREYERLAELCVVGERLFKHDKVAKLSNLKYIMWQARISHGRWKKWLMKGEASDDFYRNSPERQEWLVKAGYRYIGENAEVSASRSRLYRNMRLNGIDAGKVLLLRIEHAMDKYFHKFNLVGLNDLIGKREKEMVHLMS
jgi:D-tagatose-1,6-bisphosphate aldolase subunit GatZ/KbaZ